MELLIIKSRNHYFRFQGDSYDTCPMNKASVFPVEKVADVKILKKKGMVKSPQKGLYVKA